MKEDDRPKTAFPTRKGHFQFRKMPFGFHVMCPCHLPKIDGDMFIGTSVGENV